MNNPKMRSVAMNVAIKPFAWFPDLNRKTKSKLIPRSARVQLKLNVNPNRNPNPIGRNIQTSFQHSQMFELLDSNHLCTFLPTMAHLNNQSNTLVSHSTLSFLAAIFVGNNIK